MKMLNVVGLGPPGFAAREERSCFSWHTAAGGPGGTWKFVERPSSEAGLEAFVSGAMDTAVKEISAPREGHGQVLRAGTIHIRFLASPMMMSQFRFLWYSRRRR